MPTPAIMEALAVRLFPIRWYLLAISLGVAAALFGALAADEQSYVELPEGFFDLFLVAVSVIIWAWGLFLAAVYFHPQRGTMRIRRRRLFNLPPWGQQFVRVYAALFVTLVLALPFALLLFVYGNSR